MDLAIVDTTLITFQKEGLGIIEQGGLGIRGNKIVFVGKSDDLRDADEVIDGSNCITMPGLIDAHAHTGLALLRGGAQDMPEIEWMRKGLGPFVRNMTEKDKKAGSKLGVIEGLRSGTTTFCEFSANVRKYVENVYKPFKVRTVAVETLNEVTGVDDKGLYEFDESKGELGLKRADELVDEYGENEMVKPCYGPQALDMVSMDLIKGVNKHAHQREADIHMHVAQGERERIQVKNRYGDSTVKVISDLGMLNHRFVAVHCHDTEYEEKECMAERGVRMVGCPSSIAMIDGIVPPIHDFLSLDAAGGVGTDQAPGPGGHNMFRELRTAAVITKVRDRDPTRLPSWEVLKLGTVGGAKALGIDNGVGTLEVGKSADVITIDMSSANLTPRVSEPFHNYVATLVHSSTGKEVREVIINGDIVIRNGGFTSIDEESIVKEGQERGKCLFERGAKDWEEEAGRMAKEMG